MRKIGLLNYQYSNRNYGAVLQAAALHSFIKTEFNLSPEHIDYVPSTEPSAIYSVVRNTIMSLLMLFGFKENRPLYPFVLNSKAFERFRKMYIPRSLNKYNNHDQLVDAKFEYTHVIVGSDQVWRTTYAGREPIVYFLSFLPSTAKKISYAASFGSADWRLSEEKTKIFKNEIQNFSNISVREHSGIDICKNVFSVDACRVLDPTLLVNPSFYNGISGLRKKHGHGLVYYKLDVDKEFELIISEVGELLSTDVKDIYHDKIFGFRRYNEVQQWVEYIRSSSFVITDSYHCVCLSIVFKKPFIFYPNAKRGNDRLNSLLLDLDLRNLIYRNGNISDLVEMALKIDYLEVGKKMEALRIESHRFLRESLFGTEV